MRTFSTSFLISINPNNTFFVLYFHLFLSSLFIFCLFFSSLFPLSSKLVLGTKGVNQRVHFVINCFLTRSRIKCRNVFSFQCFCYIRILCFLRNNFTINLHFICNKKNHLWENQYTSLAYTLICILFAIKNKNKKNTRQISGI